MRPHLLESKVLDLFAGQGRLGLSALEEGASHCDFVEISRNSCLEIEKEVLKTTEVKNFFNQNNWALVRVDMTNPDAQEKLAQQFEVISLPTLIFFNPEGTECKSIRLNEKESPANFIKRLQSAQNSACR
jgi:16S rRNA G966 N2-methylase RsmD